MKHLFLAAAFLTLSAPSAFALPGMGAGGAPAAAATPSSGDHHQQFRKTQAIRALRREGLALRTADGGTLSSEHRAQLQARLDGILAGNY